VVTQINSKEGRLARHKEAERETIVSETRERLLQAATEEFAREGYVGANINRISRAAGFAKGTIYNYFESKRALMLSLIDRVAEKHLRFIAERAEEEPDPRRRLVRFFEAGFDFVSENLAPARVMVNLIYGPDEGFKAYLFEGYGPLLQFVAREIIAPGVDQGVFRPVDVEATALLLMTVYLGTASQVDPQGRMWMDHQLVADFSLHALLNNETPEKEGQDEDSGFGGQLPPAR
jgi:AcrR family transcriptional regulator